MVGIEAPGQYCLHLSEASHIGYQGCCTIACNERIKNLMANLVNQDQIDTLGYWFHDVINNNNILLKWFTFSNLKYDKKTKWDNLLNFNGQQTNTIRVKQKK